MGPDRRYVHFELAGLGMNGCPRLRHGRNRLLTQNAGSEIVALEASVFGDPCHHARADLGLLVKSKLVVGPARPHKKAVRSTLAFGAPPQSLKSGQYTPGLSGWPVVHRESQRKPQAKKKAVLRARCGRLSLRLRDARRC